MQSYAGTLGAGRATLFKLDGFLLRNVADSANRSPLGDAKPIVEETANLRRNISAVERLPGGRTAVLTFFLSSRSGRRGRRCSSRPRCATSSNRSRRSSAA